MLNYFEENLVYEMELKSGDLFFYKTFFVEVKKIREAIGEEKMEKTKARKEVNVELFIVE